MMRASMSYAVPLILMMTAIAFAGVAGAQVQMPEGPLPGISLGGPDMAAESARNYRERARYPQDSYPLQGGHAHLFPTGGPTWPYPIPSLDPSAPVISTWAAQVSFQYPAPVDLFLSLTPGKSATPGSMVAPARSVTGEIVNDAREVIGMVDYHDDGQAPDERAGDGVYAVRFIMPEAQVPDLADSFNVRIEVVMADGAVQRFGSSFHYSNPHAHLTGRYRDVVRQGSLVISAEIEVRRKGRFHLAGYLASKAGEPIGYAQTAAELEPGRYWLDLQFYGLMFHDRHIAGPYKLASLVLRTATRMPGTIGMPVLDAHITRAYRLEEMTTEPFNEPNLLDAARRLEEAAPGAKSPPQP
ncbi:choice-of-anchor X domain-containing protein [Candidatus Methylomirabilis sp.]|uniref:DUF4785 family immunoglobulin-like domain-containing protein n=1 Tax=Candidatus Methylomirabilis sp. TaxID=2032687 RepID=UPI002A5CE024|nr:hypothetical protein [Candidatus Methylomirabilis sp.]